MQHCSPTWPCEVPGHGQRTPQTVTGAVLVPERAPARVRARHLALLALRAQLRPAAQASAPQGWL